MDIERILPSYILIGIVWGLYDMCRQFETRGKGLAFAGFINAVVWPIAMILAYKNRER